MLLIRGVERLPGLRAQPSLPACFAFGGTFLCPFPSTPMKRNPLLRSLSQHNCWSLLDLVFAVACAVTIVLALNTLCAGCSTTPAGLATEASWYATGTNVVSHVAQLAPALPAPFGSIAEGAAAVAAALLAAWNTWQHKQIKSLQNGQGVAAVTKAVTDAFAAAQAAASQAAAPTAAPLAQLTVAPSQSAP